MAVANGFKQLKELFLNETKVPPVTCQTILDGHNLNLEVCLSVVSLALFLSFSVCWLVNAGMILFFSSFALLFE